MKKMIIAATIILLSFTSLSYGQAVSKAQLDSLNRSIQELQKKVRTLEVKSDENELKKLLNEGERFQSDQSESSKEKVFKTGQRSLQAINPEISVTGDVYGTAVLNRDNFTPSDRSGVNFRTLGIHLQSNLDPFSYAKIALEFSPEGVGFEDAYITWNNVFRNLSITAGSFRQQFGIVNRWHEHSLDQFDYPLALTTLLGEEGLSQLGLSAEWLMPSILADANSLTLEITNGQNDQLFAGEMFSFPTILGHFKNYYDINRDTYFELGLTGLWGRNNQRGYNFDGTKFLQSGANTYATGADLTIMWEPASQSHYRSFLLRSEVFSVHKEELFGNDINAWGGYLYGEYRFNERLFFGTRFDYTQPFAANNSGQNIYQIVPYITWWQSHWVRLRIQYNYQNASHINVNDPLLRMQLTWAMGPHKHERY